MIEVSAGLVIAALAFAVLAASSVTLGGGAAIPLSVGPRSIVLVLLGIRALPREGRGSGWTRSKNAAGVLIWRWVP